MECGREEFTSRNILRLVWGQIPLLSNFLSESMNGQYSLVRKYLKPGNLITRHFRTIILFRSTLKLYEEPVDPSIKSGYRK